MKIKVLSAAIVLCLAASQAQAYDFISGGIAYNVLTNTATRKTAAVTYVDTNPDESGYVTTYKGSVVVPAQVTDRSFNTYNVTQIGNLAMFNNQSLYHLTLPESITAIGSQAFSHCYSLLDVNIPSAVNRIGDFAFEYCEDLKTIKLPARLATMGDGVFQQCFGLESIEVDPACEEFKSIDGVLYGGVKSPNGMTLLAYPGSHPSSEYVMPDGVSTINSYALSANISMRSITLSKDLAAIEMLTFSECEVLEEVKVAEGNTHFSSVDGVLLTADGKRLMVYPLMRYAEEYEVPEGVTTIDAFAFFDVQLISWLKLPSTLTSIGELAFGAACGFRDITCMATVPPKWAISTLIPSANLFDNTIYTQATLYVPDGSVEAYKKADGWKNFAQIVPLSTAVKDLTVDETEAPAEYYNLQGQRISRPSSGVVLTRRGSKVTKEIIR